MKYGKLKLVSIISINYFVAMISFASISFDFPAPIMLLVPVSFSLNYFFNGVKLASKVTLLVVTLLIIVVIVRAIYPDYIPEKEYHHTPVVLLVGLLISAITILFLNRAYDEGKRSYFLIWKKKIVS